MVALPSERPPLYFSMEELVVPDRTWCCGGDKNTWVFLRIEPWCPSSPAHTVVNTLILFIFPITYLSSLIDYFVDNKHFLFLQNASTASRSEAFWYLLITLNTTATALTFLSPCFSVPLLYPSALCLSRLVKSVHLVYCI